MFGRGGLKSNDLIRKRLKKELHFSGNQYLLRVLPWEEKILESQLDSMRIARHREYVFGLIFGVQKSLYFPLRITRIRGK